MHIVFIVAASFTGIIPTQTTLTEGSTFSGCTFVDLTAAGTSGAIYSYGYAISLFDCQFLRCSSTSGKYCGAVYAREAPYTSNGVLSDGCSSVYVQSLYLLASTNGVYNCTCVTNCFQGSYTMSCYSTNIKQYAYNCTDNYVPGGYAASDMGSQGTTGLSKYYLCINTSTDAHAFWAFSGSGGSLSLHYVCATNSTLLSSVYYYQLANTAISFHDSIFDTSGHPLFSNTIGSTSISFTSCAFDISSSYVSGTTIDCTFGTISTISISIYPASCSYYSARTDTFTPAHIMAEISQTVPIFIVFLS